ncbi:MAG TPA: alpha/beta hydrolase [Candidatus Binatia bacterium]|nr:alpha/beta hydrolase [Candidatus Binatia bacterium]
MSAEEAPRFHYDVHDGDGPPALFVHSVLSSRSQWLPNLEALRAVCRPVVVELYGHARSPSPEEPAAYSPAGYVEGFERLRQMLGVERWLLCGSSLGAALTVRYALDYPARVLAHVFTNSMSAFADDAWQEQVSPSIAAVARALEEHGRSALESLPMNPSRGRRLPTPVREALAADYRLHDPLGIARTFRHTVLASPLGPRLPENRVPALLVAGRRETAFLPHRRRAQQSMPALAVVELDAGHAVNLEDAAGFNAAVTRFFGRAVR